MWSLLLPCEGRRAEAQTMPCPVDGTPLELATRPWNRAGGVDSDDCIYSIDADGKWFITGLETVVSCPSCCAGFLRDHLTLTFSPRQIAALTAALDEARKEQPTRSPAEWAALTYQALGAAALGLERPLEVVLAELYLRAAWSARGRAVGPEGCGRFRPQTLEEAFSEWTALAARAQQDPLRTPEVLAVDALLANLEDARAELALISPSSAERSLHKISALSALAVSERSLLAERATLIREATKQALSPATRQLDWLKASIRCGDGVARQQALLCSLDAETKALPAAKGVHSDGER